MEGTNGLVVLRCEPVGTGELSEFLGFCLTTFFLFQVAVTTSNSSTETETLLYHICMQSIERLKKKLNTSS